VATTQPVIIMYSGQTLTDHVPHVT